MKLLYVVHRYAPFPGGSEVYVQAMAEESLARKHDVTVLAGEHGGDLNGVKVTSNFKILDEPFDLIVVHGGDVWVQNQVLANAHLIPSPILYMLVMPSHSSVCVNALQTCDFLGWSTKEDIEHLKSYNVFNKGVNVRHGVRFKESIGASRIFRREVGIPHDKVMFLSCGGYWQNKKMRELAELFLDANIPNAVLVTTGYDNRFDIAPPHVPDRVIPLLIDDKAMVMNAMADADFYVMHSDKEGFGLVLLEASLNKVPWVARNIAGAKLLNDLGWTYETDSDLVSILRNSADLVNRDNIVRRTELAFDHVYKNHLIQNTVDDIERVARKAK